MLPVLVLELYWHVVQSAEVDLITNIFEVSAQLGDIPDLTTSCAFQCSLEDTCVGFDVSAGKCTLLNLPNVAPEPDHTLYLSLDRIEANVSTFICYIFMVGIFNCLKLICLMKLYFGGIVVYCITKSPEKIFLIFIYLYL